MKLTFVHTILCVLLALLYIVDCGLPCVDDCAGHNTARVAAVAAGHTDQGDHHDLPSGGHCECHCMCACHIPALLAQGAQAPAAAARDIRPSSYLLAIPTTSVSPPDHIPLS